MSPIVVCRHYEVEWLDGRTCYCAQCGRQGQWTDEGFSIWIRTDRRRPLPSASAKRKQKVA